MLKGTAVVARRRVRMATSPEIEKARREEVDELVDEVGWKKFVSQLNMLDLFHMLARDRKVIALREMFQSLGTSRQKAIELVFVLCVPYLDSPEWWATEYYSTIEQRRRVVHSDVEYVAQQMLDAGLCQTYRVASVAAHMVCGDYLFKGGLR